MYLKNIELFTLSKAWATLQRIEFDFKFKNGSWKRLSRETYNRGDGVAILLFNRKKRTVILTRQFRMPIYQNVEKEAESIEVCAGAIDTNETALATIIREVREETGYVINKAQQVMSVYTSPGAVTEKIHLFIAPYIEELKIEEGGGAKEEDEEIEVMELHFDIALDMVKQGEILDAKTILLLQYAQINNIV